MENFNFYSPTYFAFGKDGEKRAGELVKRFGGKKVLIHYGGGSAVKSGLLGRVKEGLDAAGIQYTELGGKEEDIDTLVRMACRGDGRDGNLYGFVKLSEDEVKEVYRRML